ncbi:MAG: hypothetical protein JWM27_4141 [Gemmatimonadetes bacterium]|nr:hypothetical protein [Gemmatimonadota bacterium]
MAFWNDFVKSELIDIVEWLEDGGSTLVHRFERHDNEIKNGAQLVVRPGQAAVFVNEGQLADVFQPGTYTLATANLPVLSTLRGWKYGFDSPFKAEVYFVSTRQFTDQKWGTRNPIMTRDAEFGPVRLRAFGSFAYRVGEPGKFICEIVGTNGTFTTDGIADQLRNLVVTRFSDAVGEGKIPVLDLAGNYDEMGTRLAAKVGPEFAAYGIELTKLLVENVSLPEEVERALDKRSSMGVIGNLGAYTQFQAAQALEEAAKNPGGTAAGGIGMGMGFAMANQLGSALGQNAGAGSQNAPAGPPPLPGAAPAFWIALNGQQSGPHAADALRRHVESGGLTRDTLVWRDGMAAWTPAAQVPELASLFPATPPPLPQ